MEWCICKYKEDGRLFIMSRYDREQMLAKLTKLNMDIPSMVIKSFSEYDEAVLFVAEQIKASQLINKAFER